MTSGLVYFRCQSGVRLIVGITFVMRYDTGMPKRSVFVAMVFCVALAVAFSWPLLTRLSATGVWDWSEAAATYEAARHTVFLHGQFPLWSPYLCGGYPAIGNPQTYWLSPVFLFVLLFGSIVGPKLAVVAYVAGGGAGMWLLARRLAIPHPAALLTVPIYLTSGFLGIHLSGGQFLWLTLAWVPWIFYGYVRGRLNFAWLVFGAAALTVVGLEGRSNLVAYVVLALGSLGFIEDVFAWRRGARLLRRGSPSGAARLGALGRVLVLVVVAFGLGAWKFVPDLLFMAQVQPLPEVVGAPATWLLGQLLVRDLSVHRTYREVSLVEYGYYVGYLPLLLAVLALFSARVRRRAAAWLFVGSIMLAVALAGPHNIFELLPVFSELRNPQRAMSLVIFVLALLASWGLARLPRLWQWFLLIIIVVDLLSVTSPLLAREFAKVAKGNTGDPTEIAVPFVQDEGFEPYPTVATNRGAKSFCPAVLRAWRLTTPVASYLAEDYQGEVYLEGAGYLRVDAYTPNRIVLAIESPAGVRAVVNQNAAPGWQTTVGRLAATPAGLLALDVPAGVHAVSLSYLPPGLVAGGAVTLLTALILLWTWYIYAHKAKTKS
jgi:hypothetical protein